MKISNARFHHLGEDGLYHPIAFLFVTERMRDDILDERETLLSLLPTARHERQKTLFSQYDPEVSVQAFKGLLRMYGYPFVNRAPTSAS